MFPDEEGKEETTDQETIRDIDFGIDDIKDAKEELGETPSPGTDKFPSIILKKYREFWLSQST